MGRREEKQSKQKNKESIKATIRSYVYTQVARYSFIFDFPSDQGEKLGALRI